jgi:hypothetical protein
MKTLPSSGNLSVASILALCVGVGLLVATSAGDALAVPRVEVVLSLSYGSGPGQVGATKSGEPVPEAFPQCPEMFWMTQDGLIWVLDTVNSRLLAFRDGKQSIEISTREVEKRPRFFGVTRGAVFLVQGVNVDGPKCRLVRIDRASLQTSTGDLRLPDGRRFLPQKVMPLGQADEMLLISGCTYPSEEGGSVVVDSDGKLVSVQLDGGHTYGSNHMPAADGGVWRMARLDLDEQTEVPVTLERYGAETEAWTMAFSGAFPRRPELSAQRKRAMSTPLGIDTAGAAVVVLFEGRPLSPRFLRLSPSGEAAAVTLEELGMDSAPLGTFFPSQHFQLLPDGSILAQYTTPDQYRIIQLTF